MWMWSFQTVATLFFCGDVQGFCRVSDILIYNRLKAQMDFALFLILSFYDHHYPWCFSHFKRQSMNTERGPGRWVASLASWHNQSPMYPLSVLSIQGLYYLSYSIDKRDHYILTWKMAPQIFVTWSMLHRLTDTAWVCVFERYNTVASTLSFKNVLGCLSVCVGTPHTHWKKNSGQWVGTYSWNKCLYYVLRSLDMWGWNTKVKLWENRSHQSWEVYIFLQWKTTWIQADAARPQSGTLEVDRDR